MFEITSDLEIIQSTEDPEEYSQKFDCFKRYEIFKQALSQLSEIHQDIIVTRHSSNKLTLNQLSIKHKLSVEKIRQLEAESISIMKSWIDTNILNKFEYI